MRIDLHSHSTASDGTERPAEVVRRARAAGLDVLALTDHDGVGGHREAIEALPEGLTLVPGMELSCRRDGMSVHLLAYLFDEGNAELAAELELIRAARDDRAAAMVARIAELGVPITLDMVTAIAGGGVIGRPHIARAVVAAGAVPTVEDAFTPEWIGTGGRAHVSRYALDPVRAVLLTRAAGGTAVLAHPRAARRGRTVPDAWIAEMAAAGLAGVEADHPDHTSEARAEIRALAADLDLIVTGSSDDHGSLTGHRLGCETTSPDQYERLLASRSATL
ncbi:phosphatase [Acrocarpospora phusangensis]|uniref:Phosphatase n=1 Tax=Acrocarpospora phusangensis TaxID=1070424 RepID=A0A919QA86_9ACTN|nr:PHP domain-containing protein [Acrocarpospora phusangensis]GIH25091.1 phosphatase [Acrocarpospora phusangensis]